MSFNRLDYDKCAYAQRLSESTSPLDYALFKGKYENNKDCKLSSHANDMSQLNKTLIENELYNLNRSSTLCSSKKFNPNSKAKVIKHSPAYLCENIHQMTPSGLSKISSNGLSKGDNKKC
tara:strand:+ start:622 stop:981 length:360 start_codon:yes stop_codon:yes gene_type:complete